MSRFKCNELFSKTLVFGSWGFCKSLLEFIIFAKHLLTNFVIYSQISIIIIIIRQRQDHPNSTFANFSENLKILYNVVFRKNDSEKNLLRLGSATHKLGRRRIGGSNETIVKSSIFILIVITVGKVGFDPLNFQTSFRENWVI